MKDGKLKEKYDELRMTIYKQIGVANEAKRRS